MKVRWKLSALAMMTTVVVFAFGALTASAAPVPAGSVTVAAQEKTINLSWPASTTGETFAVWRAVDATTARARVVGFTDAPTFIDSTAIVGARYKYAVVALGSTAMTAPAAADYTAAVSFTADPMGVTPHRSGAFDPANETCVRCHSISDPIPGTALLVDLGGDVTTQTGLCADCHGGVVEDPATGFSTGLSGHTVALTDPVDGALSCASCHDPHGDTAANGSLAPAFVERGGERREVVATATNGLCDACHTAADATDPTWDPNGYPVTGRYPGGAVFSSATNAHASLIDTNTPAGDITKPAGSCLYCHGPHRTAAPYDGLLVVGTASAPVIPNATQFDSAPLCADCHAWVAPSATATPEEIADWGVHRISSPNGVFAPGSSLPCYACHNPHGSARGNASNLSDTLGAGLDTSTAAGTRAFCFTCHTTSEGFGWDSTAGAYAAVPAASDEIFGFSRTATDAVGATAALSKLPVPAIGGNPETDFHAAGYTGEKACYDCHTSAHHPSLDGAGLTCYSCHGDTMGMDKADANATATFHHVLGSSETSYTGDVLLAGYQPPSAENGFTKTCLSCHTDHLDSGFDGRGPLRTSTVDAATASSDFMTGANPGVCVDCHQTSLTRGPATSQMKAFVRVTGGAEVTSVKAIDPAAFAGSPHNYDVTTPSGAAGNCSKCHNSGQVAADGMSFSTNAVHTSPNRSLLGLAGDDTALDESRNCFSCHARRGDLAQTTTWGKELANRDWFGVKTMAPVAQSFLDRNGSVIGVLNADSQSVFPDLYRVTGVDLASAVPSSQWAPSGHQPGRQVPAARTSLLQSYRDSSTTIECADCHDVHASGEVLGDWPLTTQALPAIGSVPGSTSGRGAINTNGRALDGSRLITLNDFMYAQQNPTSTTKVDIVCFNCHDIQRMAAPHTTYVHVDAWMACVNCHVPTAHGSGMPDMLSDATPGVMPLNQQMTWYDHIDSRQPNSPVSKVLSYDPQRGGADMGSCSTDCHYLSEDPSQSNWR